MAVNRRPTTSAITGFPLFVGTSLK